MQNNFENDNDEMPSLPFDNVWADLKPQLDKEAARREKRKRRFIFFWFTFIAIGILVGTGMLMVDSANKSSLKAENHNKTIGNKNELAEAENKDASIAIAPENSSPARVRGKNTPVKIENAPASSSSTLVRSENARASSSSTLVRSENVLASNSSAHARSENVLASNSSAHARSENALAGGKNAFVRSETPSLASKTVPVGSETSPKDSKNPEEINVVASNEIHSNESITKNTNEQQIIINKQQETTNNEQQQTKNEQQETPNPKPPTPNKKPQTILSYGLQWNLPLQNGLQYNDINADNKPLLLLIPQLWVSKQLGKKHSVMLSFNPYAQYFVSNKAVANSTYYEAMFYSGSQVDNKPEKLRYIEANLFNKLISLEASLTYQYQLSSRIKIGASVGNNWVQGALLKNRITKNSSTITRDSLYGIDKKDAEWAYVKHTFLLGKIELQYKIKKVDVGISFSKPISNMFNNIEESKTPINTNLFIRWNLNK